MRVRKRSALLEEYFFKPEPVTVLAELGWKEEELYCPSKGHSRDMGTQAPEGGMDHPVLADLEPAVVVDDLQQRSASAKMLKEVGRGETSETLTAQEQEESGHFNSAFGMVYVQPDAKTEDAEEGRDKDQLAKPNILAKVGENYHCLKIFIGVICLLAILTAIAIGFFFGLQQLHQKHHDRDRSTRPRPITTTTVRTTTMPAISAVPFSPLPETTDNRTLVEMVEEEEEKEDKDSLSVTTSVPLESEKDGEDEMEVWTTKEGGFRLEDLVEDDANLTTIAPEQQLIWFPD